MSGLATHVDLDYAIKRAVKHYSSLFALPPYWKIAGLTLLICVVGSLLSVFLSHFSLVGMVFALQFSLLLFLASGVSDVVVQRGFTKADPIYNVRRCAALSMFSLLLWFGFLLVGSVLARFTSWTLWNDLAVVGFAAVAILRLIVLLSTSFTAYWRAIGASFTQPLLSLLAMFYVSNLMGYAPNDGTLILLLVSIPLAVATASMFIRSVNKVGIATLGVPTTTVLKAFLANWMEDLRAPVERLFERFGKERSVDFSLLAFKTDDGFKSAVAVSSCHPGPFKNVGSSMLPFLIQRALAQELHCCVAVPHGLFGHEFDLSSEQQNQKVLRNIVSSARFPKFSSEATPFVKARKGLATASCQVFGDCAVVILTLAPETTEDFPREVGDFILEEAAKLGLAHAVVINAHNSINGSFNVDSVIAPLKEAASDVLREASALRPLPFEVGAAKVMPEDCGVEDGMGPGGICALVIRVNGQTCAYVTIDGNNMITGLRAKILEALKELSMDAGEVLTTDTHAVNAVIKTARGYHPLGETIAPRRLITYIKSAVEEALRHMKPASAAWRHGVVANVNVIGEKQIEELSSLADRALRRAKRTAVALFAMAGLLLIAVLAAF
jgi:predicted neutral ceramidase superfamily lipid hydrolase